MKILITGGTGYLGGRIVEYFLQKKKIVIIATRERENDNNFSGAKIKNINWDDNSSLLNICQDVDVVIHAAGINANECIKNPEKALEFNGRTTARLLESAITQKVSKFIFLSTAHVYSNPLVGKINELSYTKNLHPYATSNIEGENAVLNANPNIKSVVLRLANVVGAPTHKNADCWMLLINNLCKQAVLYKKMIINSSVLLERNFISIGDVNRFLEYLIIEKKDYWKYKIYNLAGEKSFSILEIAKMIQNVSTKLLGYKPEISFKEKLNDGIVEKLDYSSIRMKEFEFETKIDIEVEIKNTLLFCKKNFTL